MRLVSLPSAISLLRVPLAALFLAVEGPAIRAAILAAAAASDFLDGWLARRLGQTTRAGELLDPLTDKIFLVAVLFSFALDGRLAPWQLLVLLGRDLFAIAAFLTVVVFGLPIRFRARLGGKIVTGVQLAAVLVLLVRPEWIGPLVVIAAVTGTYAVLDYTRVGLRALRAAARHG
ncbi:MAG TPA: CDP-alcohol phosphatidyltransferase family protein [Longimicrobiales bacterium]